MVEEGGFGVQGRSSLEESEARVDGLREELLELQDGGTPRPDWQRCGQVVEGGEARWRGMLRGRTSDQLVSGDGV